MLERSVCIWKSPWWMRNLGACPFPGWLLYTTFRACWLNQSDSKKAGIHMFVGSHCVISDSTWVLSYNTYNSLASQTMCIKSDTQVLLYIISPRSHNLGNNEINNPSVWDTSISHTIISSRPLGFSAVQNVSSSPGGWCRELNPNQWSC